MIELGQLERRHADFERLDARVIVASIEGHEDARQTQADFPHLVVLTDAHRNLAQAADVIHANSAPGHGDTSAPTTVIIGRDGKVSWLYRPVASISRLSPDDLLQAIGAD